MTELAEYELKKYQKWRRLIQLPKLIWANYRIFRKYYGRRDSLTIAMVLSVLTLVTVMVIQATGMDEECK